MADDLLNFFTDINHKFQPVRTNRFIEERGPTDDFRSDTEEKNENEKAYAKKYEQEEAQNLRKVGFYNSDEFKWSTRNVPNFRDFLMHADDIYLTRTAAMTIGNVCYVSNTI